MIEEGGCQDVSSQKRGGCKAGEEGGGGVEANEDAANDFLTGPRHEGRLDDAA